MRKILLLIICFMFLLVGCVYEPQEVEETVVGESVQNTQFILSIVVENPEAKSNEAIECYALLTYIGQEPITIYHSSPLVAFGIDDDNYFSSEFIREDMLMTTTFKPEQEQRINFAKNGSWNADDPNASLYKEFYSKKELILPEGEYALSANVKYFLDENDAAGSIKTMKVSVDVKVSD